jgi:hypothetical protein
MEKSMQLGTTFWIVRSKNNAFTRQKIFFDDQNGVRWYRYDKPIWVTSVQECRVTGIIKRSFEGEIPPESYEAECEIYALNESDEPIIIDEDRVGIDYFLTREDAEKRKDEIDKEHLDIS